MENLLNDILGDDDIDIVGVALWLSARALLEVERPESVCVSDWLRVANCLDKMSDVLCARIDGMFSEEQLVLFLNAKGLL